MNQVVKKGGKLPISQKNDQNSDFGGDRDTSLLRVDPKIKKELAEKGFACRWISLREYQTNGNFHKQDWTPYKVSAGAKGPGEFASGTNPEGYIVRKELVLAVRPLEAHNAHKAQIRRRTASQSQIQKVAAQKLRETLGQSGAKVYEGYEENSKGSGFDQDDE
jgi:hypothetical protein